jgi:hypothetical protein
VSKSAAQRLAPRVTVTHEKNAPVLLAPTKKDAVQSAWGNGVASTITFTDPLVVTAEPPKAGAEPGKVGAADEVIEFEPDVITAKAPKAGAEPGKVDAPGEVIEFEPETITARAPDVPAPDKEAPGEAKAPDGPAAKSGGKGEPAEVARAGAEEAEEDEEEAPGEEEAEEGKEEAEAEGEGEAAEAEPVEPEPPKEAKKPGAKAGAGGDGASDLAGWKARAAGATQATPQPTLGEEPAARVTVIKGAGTSAAGKHKAAGGALAAEAKKAVRKPPETPKPLPPPPPTAVPAADKLITDASDKKLPNQELPLLVERPGDPKLLGYTPTAPVMDTDLGEDLATGIALPGAEPAPELAPGDKKPLDAAQLEKLKEAKAKAPEENKKGKPGQKMVLEDKAPPPSPSLETGTKGASKEKVAQVLAELLRAPGPEGEADKIVSEARAEAYPRKALEMEWPELGNDKKTEVQAELKAQVDSIRAIAGLTADELDAAIKTRAETLKALESGAMAAVDTAREDAKTETKEGGEKTAEDIAGARDAVDEATIQTAIAANGEADPTVIELRRDKGIRDLTRRTARQDVYYEKSGERRTRALDAAYGRMRNAYKNAATADQRLIYKRIYDEEKAAKKADADAAAAATTRSETEALPIFQWAGRQTKALEKQFASLKEEATGKTKIYRDAVKEALESAKEMLRTWAEDRIARQEGLFDWLIRKFNEWMKEAKDDSAAWEEARNEQLRDTLVGDLKLIDELDMVARGHIDAKTFIEERGLDQAQMGIMQTYFAGVGPEGKKQLDSIGAVAAGMRMRVRATRKPGLIEWCKDQVIKLPDDQWQLMGRIGNAERPPFNVVALASDLFHAMDQWGTDEDKIFQALAGLTPIQARAIRARYKIRYKRSLDEHLDSEMSGAEMTRAEALLAGNQTKADVATLYEAMHGGLTGAGTDEDAIMLVLRNKTAEERAAIVDEYKKRYGIDLNKDLKSELDDGWSSHHDFDRSTALMAGNTAKADAIAIDASMHGGTGAGTDEAEITRVYEQNRAEVEAEAARKGWSTDEINAEVKRRNGEIERQYESKYGDPTKLDQPTALRRAFKSEMEGAELGLANALADGDITKIDAAKLGVEKQSFITSDETVNKILQSQATRARKDVERDVMLDLEYRAEVDSLRGRDWKAADWARERGAAKTKIEEESAKRAMLYMGNLETTFDKDWGGGKGGLVVMIAFNMSGDDKQKAFDLRKQGGILKPEQEIYYAVNGVGTDLDKLKEVLKGKSPDEVKKIRDAWNAKYKDSEGDFDSRVLEEVGGRDYQDMKWALAGEPQDMDGKLARAKERMDYENEGYGVWGDFAEEKADVKDQYDSLEAEKLRLERLKHLKDDKKEGESDEAYAARLEKYAYWEESFKLQEGYFDRAIEDHRTAVDSFADTAATIAGIVAVVVVMVVVAIFTAGTGAAAIGAALASAKVAAAGAIAAAAATIATKQLIKGSAYSHEELAVDAITGAVDAVASAMTAGVGGGLLKAARVGGPASKLAGFAAKSKLATGLAKMAASERMAARIFAGAMAEGIEGVVSSLPSALAGNVLDEKNWVKGNPLANILQGTVIQTGIGAVVSGGMGGLGGIGKNVDLPAKQTGDILAKRGTPAERLPLWKAWKADNPGKPYKQFLEQLDAGIIAKDVDDSARKAMQREMRGELMSAIPPAQRGQFADVPIQVMADADFDRFTRSASGQAVVIFKDGKPIVILREGADIKALREEGIHLVQSKDPKWAKKFKQLDEARLANWEKLPLDEQLALYRTKLDIEIDAQQRLIKGLDDQLASIDDPALRKSLLARREAAAANFESLGRRLDEVAGMSPADKLKIARKEMKPPQYLDQKPRLFSKASNIDKAAAKDKNFGQALARRARAMSAMAAIIDKIEAGASKKTAARVRGVLDTLGEVWKTFGERDYSFLTKSVAEILNGRKFAQLLDAAAKGPTFFDSTKALRSLVASIKELADPKQLQRLDELVAGTRKLLDSKSLDLKHIDLFVSIAPKFASPGKLLAMVDTLAGLASFRVKALFDVSRALKKSARAKGAAVAAQFSDEVHDLAKLARIRDKIDKVKQPKAWSKAQDALDKAGKVLEPKAASFGLSTKQVSGIIEEMSRSGKFDWDVFRQVLFDKNPLKKEKYKPMKALIADLQKAVKASGEVFDDVDIGPILHWGPIFRDIHQSLGAKEQTKLVASLKTILLETAPGMSYGSYGKYRTALKDRAVAYIAAATSSIGQWNRLTAVMKIVRERDPASIGEYFAAFRRKIFEKGKPLDIQGPLRGAADVRINRQLHGVPRVVDGAIDLPTARKGGNGPSLPGRYFVEDKAGKSFELAQAKVYSQLLDKKKLRTGDPKIAIGLIYFCEKPSQADFIVGELHKHKLNSQIFVATFDDKTGKLKFVPRPGAGIKGVAASGKKKKKT